MTPPKLENILLVPMNTTTQRPTAGQIEKVEHEAVCADQYYQMLRWSKRLHDARCQDPDTLDSTVAAIIDELNDRAGKCFVKEQRKESVEFGPESNRALFT
jgi:hypothetical protein